MFAAAVCGNVGDVAKHMFSKIVGGVEPNVENRSLAHGFVVVELVIKGYKPSINIGEVLPFISARYLMDYACLRSGLSSGRLPCLNLRCYFHYLRYSPAPTTKRTLPFPPGADRSEYSDAKLL